MTVRGTALVCLAMMALAGCGAPVHDEALAGPYRLFATDGEDQRMLCLDMGSSGCAGDGLPGKTVIAAGANDRYVVMVRRVHNDRMGEAPSNVGEIEYYYIIRTGDEARGVAPASLIGPMTKEQFEEAKPKNGLPEFSRIFEPLP